MKKSFLKLFFYIVMVILISGIQVSAQDENTDTIYKYRYNSIPIKQPKISKAMQPAVIKYRRGDYLGAMLDLEKVYEKNPDDLYAEYYLALCYTQLGYKDKAIGHYKTIVESNESFPLARYSQMALICIDNPDNEFCLPPKKNEAPKTTKDGKPIVQEEDNSDIGQFIRSGKKIHPAAMDQIINERMQRKIQSDLYLQQQMQNENQQNGSSGRHHTSNAIESDKKAQAIPDSNEIVAALDVLTRAGLNPMLQLNPNNNPVALPISALSAYNADINYGNPLLNTILSNRYLNNPEMLMYSQMAQQNNILNGI